MPGKGLSGRQLPKFTSSDYRQQQSTAHNPSGQMSHRASMRLEDPGPLIEGDLTLVLDKILQPDSGHDLPAYRFAMRRVGTREAVGEIGLKVGEPPAHLGHVWFRVAPAHRGNRYAARACRLLVGLARRHGIDPIQITCRTDNWASRRTAEIAGAEFCGTVETPDGYEDWLGPVRMKCVYHLRTMGR